MAVYNVDKIDNWYNDFVSLKNKFNNTYYSDYKSSYIRSCSDSAVKKMQSSLNKHYSKIQKMYNNINTTWNLYLQDLKNTDIRLAGGKGGINASSVSSKLAKLPVLQEYKRSLEVRIKSISGVVGTAKGIGWSENRTIDQNLEYLGNRVGATITTAAVSLVEGLGIFAEGLVDVAAITTTGIATVIAYATSNADEAEEISNQIWEDCRAFTSKQYVKSAFNSFYENTDVGKSLKKDSYAFDVVRNVGNEVGEVLGAVGISVATGGVINPAILYGTSKAGTHVEENWQDENTSTAAGLVKGTLQGIGDGIFFALGMKGDAVMKSAAINAVKKGGQQALKKTAILTGKTLFECGCSVAQDGSNILINAIFSDDIVQTQDGKNVKLNSFSDKLNFYYEQAGGMEGLMTSMATASVLSFASDFVDVSKIGKNIDTNTAIKNADINANNMKNTIEGVNPKNIEVSSNVKKANVNDNLDVLRKEYDDLINWKNSDEGLYSKRLNEVYGDRFGSNSRYKRNMARIAELEIDINRIDKVSKSLDQLDISSSDRDIITEKLCTRYKNARTNANGKYNKTFKSYRDHGELHVLEVADYSKKMAQQNVNLNDSDVMEVYFAGLTHDLGMADSFAMIDPGSGIVKLAYEIDGGVVRKNHPLNSALIVLQDSAILPKGMDTDKVALLTLTHSKSTSGIKDFSDKKMWTKAIDNLDDASKKLGIDFDADRMKKIINDDNSFKKIQEQAVCLRDGDAMSKVPLDANGNQIMQTGQSVILINNNPRKDFNDIIKEDSIEFKYDDKSGKLVPVESALEREMYDISDTLSSGEKIDDVFGKAYHIGENNVRFNSNYTGKGEYVADVYLVDANNVPNASGMVISERVGEINTYGNIDSRKMFIHLPKGAENTKLGDFYKNFNYGNNKEVRIKVLFDL